MEGGAMPWKVSDEVNERMHFVSRLEDGERMTDLCMEFGISRKTGYKIWNRFRLLGPRALYDQSRRPAMSPRTTSKEIQKLIVEFRKKHPTWGARKLKVELERRHPALTFPAQSTVYEILKRSDLVVPRPKCRKRGATPSGHLADSHAPNEIWCVDFKGDFLLGNRHRCYPLTLSDHYSRFLLGCEALENTKSPGAQTVFEATFRKYGMPYIIRTDNGAPFASTGLMGLSKLSVWWMRLGIIVERIAPGHPEQNGRHERMHRTLKLETCRPPAGNTLQQQERFDGFQYEYNHERPHESLDMKRPADVYTPSPKRFPEHIEQLQYPLHDETLRVSGNGHLYFNFGKCRQVYLGIALAGQHVGLREVDEHRWLVSFLDKNLGYIDKRIGRLVTE